MAHAFERIPEVNLPHGEALTMWSSASAWCMTTCTLTRPHYLEGCSPSAGVVRGGTKPSPGQAEVPSSPSAYAAVLSVVWYNLYGLSPYTQIRSLY